MGTLCRLFPAIGAARSTNQCALFHFETPNIRDYGKHKLVKDPARQDPEYFEKEAEKLPLNEFYIDKLKYLYEQKRSSARDLYRKAADLLVGDPRYGLPEIDMTLPRLEYRNVDALKDAPDSVKKIFSVLYGERRDLTAAWKAEFISRVRDHEFDGASLESRIAYITACIRHHSALIDELISKHPQGKHPRHLIQRMMSMIFWRRRAMKTLRATNIESFERLLSELKLAYTVPTDEKQFKTRKEWSEHQLQKRCKIEKERRLKELHDQLLDGREERVASIDAELSALQEEESRVREHLAELDLVEGRSVTELRGHDEPKLIEEFTELMIHRTLFYHPPPAKAGSPGAVATTGV